MIDLTSPVDCLKGVGKARSSRLARLEIETVEDLLHFYPRRYEDRRAISKLSEISPDSVCSSIVKVISVDSRVSSRKKMILTEAMVSDGTALVSAIWFNSRNLANLLAPGRSLGLHGRVSYKGGLRQFVNPEVEVLWEDRPPRQMGCIVAVYALTAGLSDQWMRTTVDHVLRDFLCAVDDPIPESIRSELGLIDLRLAIETMHRPPSPEAWRDARKRLAFDELFTLQLGLATVRSRRDKVVGAPALPCNGPLRSSLERALPFALSSDQSRVLDEIGGDMASDVPMNRLLQGDVGSGKTAVALLAMMQAVDGGAQAALMVPTSVLAQQHGSRIESMLSPYGVRVETLIGGLPQGERRSLLEDISSGDVNVVIGTHALIQEDVSFKKLGLVVIDEQHRFGVLQRVAIGTKGVPHVLVMTATPIPRTLALSVYGDLSVSVIRTMPKGRIPVKTRVIGEHKVDDLYGFMEKEIGRDRRVFWVCPIIEGSEHLDAGPLEDRFAALEARFGDKVGMIHGRMALSARQEVMRSFASGEKPILACTTVIEVGVDVPEATVMVVENAERFGLSQLHQLRGRVGRGSEQAWCFLLGKPKTTEGVQRLEALCRSSDGFAVAEADMAIRGPGEICGVRQHGITDFKVADLIRDVELLETARERAFRLVEEDRDLSSFPSLRDAVLRRYGRKLGIATTA
ncbi:ATP-dependent DNA helicase RecG [Dethiosulfovibrio salsuginis]|uniref:ATP-dependent DNA helicase RecG n=1 Tax=Dethiosulfovibrio salsuginis TaxID=561720 RepID=A0A1X7J0L8_9BACT|nr:ATP-dependent DNA helicase RecG [Dethiosulfovibrio salsuginis]SMG21136.1 ATP-dependent DNA helicase RecG [Dethiosulfovibrio salsuginis]